MKYVSERVINISELEELIRLSYHTVVAIRNELDKQDPSVAKMVYLSEQAKQNLSEVNAVINRSKNGNYNNGSHYLWLGQNS